MKPNAPSPQQLVVDQLRKQFPEWTIRFVYGDHNYTAHRQVGRKGRLNFKSRYPLAVVSALSKAQRDHFPETKQPEPEPPGKLPQMVAQQTERMRQGLDPRYAPPSETCHCGAKMGEGTCRDNGSVSCKAMPPDAQPDDPEQFEQLPGDYFLPRYPHTWPEKLYVTNSPNPAPEVTSKGFREFNGPGGHFAGEYGYAIYRKIKQPEAQP